jgi:hypothetical protein
MSTRAINVDKGEGKIFRPKREGGGDGEIVHRMVQELKELIIPCRDDTPRSAQRRYEKERSKRRRKKRGRKEGGDSGKL